MYDKDLYLKELKEEELRKSKLGLIKYKFQRIATKQHFCEKCGAEIHKNEIVWWYKPYPKKNKRTKKVKFFKWRTRCSEHPPVRYNPETFDEEVSESCYEDNGYGRF